MKVRQNGQWKNLGGIDVGRFGNYTLLTPEMISGTLGDTSQRYIGTATHLIIDDSFPTNSLNSLFRDNQTLKSLVILTNKITDMTNIFNSIGSQFEKRERGPYMLFLLLAILFSSMLSIVLKYLNSDRPYGVFLVNYIVCGLLGLCRHGAESALQR